MEKKIITHEELVKIIKDKTKKKKVLKKN